MDKNKIVTAKLYEADLLKLREMLPEQYRSDAERVRALLTALAQLEADVQAQPVFVFRNREEPA